MHTLYNCKYSHTRTQGREVKGSSSSFEDELPSICKGWVAVYSPYLRREGCWVWRGQCRGTAARTTRGTWTTRWKISKHIFIDIYIKSHIVTYIHIHICMYINTSYLEKVGILATGCRRKGNNKAQKVKRRYKNVKTDFKSKGKTILQKFDPKFWLP